MGNDADQLVRNVGLRVAELRRAAGLTQEDFAEKAEVSVNYVRRVEQGLENLGLRSIAKLAKLLRVAPREFFRVPRSRVAKPGRPRKVSVSRREGRAGAAK